MKTENAELQEVVTDLNERNKDIKDREVQEEIFKELDIPVLDFDLPIFDFSKLEFDFGAFNFDAS